MKGREQEIGQPCKLDTDSTTPRVLRKASSSSVSQGIKLMFHQEGGELDKRTQEIPEGNAGTELPPNMRQQNHHRVNSNPTE